MAKKPQEVAKTTDLAHGPLSAMDTFAHRCGVKSGSMAIDLLKASCFKDIKEDAQIFTAIVICNEYKLNPFLREIFILPTKRGLVPYVSIDGWHRIVNGHPQFDGWEVEVDIGQGGKLISATCKIARKDRSIDTVVTEFYSENYRNTDPWNNRPVRMLRHRAKIQCAREAFGFFLCDRDEAESIRDAEFTEVEGTGNEAVRNLLASRKIIAPTPEAEIPEAERKVLEEVIAGEEKADAQAGPHS